MALLAHHWAPSVHSVFALEILLRVVRITTRLHKRPKDRTLVLRIPSSFRG